MVSVFFLIYNVNYILCHRMMKQKETFNLQETIKD